MNRELVLAIIQEMKHGVTFNMMIIIIFVEPLMDIPATMKIKDGI